MDLSIIVVHTGPAALLAPCLGSIAAHAPWAETIVAWNRCDPADAGAVMDRAPWAKFLLRRDNRGFTAAVNAGVGEARGDAFWILNGDARITPDAAERLVRAASAPGVAAVGAQLVDAAGRRRPSWSDLAPWPALALLPRRAREALGPRPGPCGVVEVPALIGAAMVVPRGAWARVGPFDPRFFLYFVETDWCRRARAAGLRILLDREAPVLHDGAASTRDRERADREYDHGRIEYVEKTWGPGAARCFRALRMARAGLNAGANATLWLASVGRAGRARDRARRYAATLAWYRAGAPASAGIADAVRAPDADPGAEGGSSL